MPAISPQSKHKALRRKRRKTLRSNPEPNLSKWSIHWLVYQMK